MKNENFLPLEFSNVQIILSETKWIRINFRVVSKFQINTGTKENKFFPKKTSLNQKMM